VANKDCAAISLSLHKLQLDTLIAATDYLL